MFLTPVRSRVHSVFNSLLPSQTFHLDNKTNIWPQVCASERLMWKQNTSEERTWWKHIIMRLFVDSRGQGDLEWSLELLWGHPSCWGRLNRPDLAPPLSAAPAALSYPSVFSADAGQTVRTTPPKKWDQVTEDKLVWNFWFFTESQRDLITWMWSGQAYLAIFLDTVSFSRWGMSASWTSTPCFSTTKAYTPDNR